MKYIDMTDEDYENACSALQDKIVNLLHEDDSPMEVGMHVMSALIAQASFRRGLTQFECINHFVTIAKEAYDQHKGNKDE